MTIIGVLFNVFCSVVASFVFWILTFRISRTKVKFAEHIEKSPDVYDDPDRYRYRIKLVNIGDRDLLEVTCLVRLIVHGKHTNNNSYIRAGNYDTRPILLGRKWQKKNPEGRFAWMLPIQMTDTAYKDFTKKFYPEHIRAAANQRTLTVEDVLKEFNPKATIIIYLFGYDAVTGARRMFQSKSYSYADIVEGRYNRRKSFKRYNDYIDHLLGISPRQVDPPESNEAAVKEEPGEAGDMPKEDVTRGRRDGAGLI